MPVCLPAPPPPPTWCLPLIRPTACSLDISGNPSLDQPIPFAATEAHHLHSLRIDIRHASGVGCCVDLEDWPGLQASRGGCACHGQLQAPAALKLASKAIAARHVWLATPACCSAQAGTPPNACSLLWSL